jgi:hypothetical protein
LRTQVLVALDLIRLVSSVVMTLNAPPRISSQQRRLAVRFIAVNGLPQTTVLTRHDEIPNVRFTDRKWHGKPWPGVVRKRRASMAAYRSDLDECLVLEGF